MTAGPTHTVSAILTQIFGPTLAKPKHSSSVHRYVSEVLTRDDDWARRNRGELESLIDVAERHGILNANTQRRLRSSSARLFWGFVNELKVAAFFEQCGITISFHPSGRGRKVGEFLADLQGPVFVEVKTTFPRPPEEIPERIGQNLCEVIRDVGYPGHFFVMPMKVAPDFSRRHFASFLKSVIPTLAGESATEPAKAIYRDPSGLSALIGYRPPYKIGLVDCSPSMSYWVADQLYIRASVEEANRKLDKALPNLVVICSKLVGPPPPAEFLAALYESNSRFTDRAGRPLRPLLTQRSLQRVSAVAQFDDQAVDERLRPFIHCYHHPQPYMQIAPDRLDKIALGQYEPSAGWIRDPRPAP